MTPSAAWRKLFNLTEDPSTFTEADSTTTAQDPSETPPVSPEDVQETAQTHSLFTPSTIPAHKLILRTLAENPPQTITIVVIGPMTNVALAANEDVETFLRAKEVVVMGGAVDVPGNVCAALVVVASVVGDGVLTEHEDNAAG